MDLKDYLKERFPAKVVEKTPSDPLKAEVGRSLKREFKIEVFNLYTKLSMEILMGVIRSYYVMPLSLESEEIFIGLKHDGKDMSFLQMDCKIHVMIFQFVKFYQICVVFFDEGLKSDVPFTLADFQNSKPFFPKQMD